MGTSKRIFAAMGGLLITAWMAFAASAQPARPTLPAGRHRLWLPFVQGERTITTLHLDTVARWGLDLDGESHASLIDRGIAYFVQGRHLVLWNLTKVGRQGLLATLELPTSARPAGLVVQDGIAVVLASDRLFAVAIRPLEAPRICDTLVLPGVISAFAHAGQQLYVAVEGRAGLGADSQVLALRIQPEGSLMRENGLSGLPTIRRMVAGEGRLWAATEGAILSLDMASTPPRLVSRHESTDDPVGLLLSEDRLWLIHREGGMRSWPLRSDLSLGAPSDTVIPRGNDTWRFSRLIYDEAVLSKDLACVASSSGRSGIGGPSQMKLLTCLDLSSGEAPRFAWRRQWEGRSSPTGLRLNDNILAIGGDRDGGLLYIELTPEDPGPLRRLDPRLGVGSSLLSAGDTLYSVEGATTLRAWHFDVDGLPQPSSTHWALPGDHQLISTVPVDGGPALRWLVFGREDGLGQSLYALDLAADPRAQEPIWLRSTPPQSGTARASHDLLWFPEAPLDSTESGLFAINDAGLLRKVELPDLAGWIADVALTADHVLLALRTPDGRGALVVLDAAHSQVQDKVLLPEAPTAIYAEGPVVLVATGPLLGLRHLASSRWRAGTITVDLMRPPAERLVTRVDLPLSGVTRIQGKANRIFYAGWRAAMNSEGKRVDEQWLCETTSIFWPIPRSCRQVVGDAWPPSSWALAAGGAALLVAERGLGLYRPRWSP